MVTISHSVSRKGPQMRKIYDLLPCPFCGGKAIVEHSHRAFINAQSTRVTFVRCKKCNARTNRVQISEYGHTSESTEATDRAVEYWNRRANN